MDVLIERESELAALGEVVEAATSGRGGAVLIEGEAGIGKTRLLAAARARASAAGARVLYARTDETEARVPLAAARALLVRAARSVAADGPARLGALALNDALAEPIGPGSRTDEVVHALWWMIVELAEEQPLAVLLDDAHWADELTLRVLRMAARRASELSLALVVAARPASPGSAHAMLGAERAFVRLEPAPLSVAGTARLFPPSSRNNKQGQRRSTGQTSKHAVERSAADWNHTRARCSYRLKTRVCGTGEAHVRPARVKHHLSTPTQSIT